MPIWTCRVGGAHCIRSVDLVFQEMISFPNTVVQANNVLLTKKLVESTAGYLSYVEREEDAVQNVLGAHRASSYGLPLRSTYSYRASHSVYGLHTASRAGVHAETCQHRHVSGKQKTKTVHVQPGREKLPGTC